MILHKKILKCAKFDAFNTKCTILNLNSSTSGAVMDPQKGPVVHIVLKAWDLAHFLAYISQGVTSAYIFSCDQAAVWLVLSVCPSVRHTFFTMFPSSYHPEIFRTYNQWQKWRPCKRSRSKVKVTEVNTQLNRFRTVTPVWIHIWWWNDAYSLMMLRRGALFFKVIRQISRSHGSKKRWIWPRLGVSGL